MNTFALVVVFPDLGEARLLDERIPHSVSLKYHQEEVTGEKTKGHKGVFSSHLFPSFVVSQHKTCKAERETSHRESSQDSGESVCGPSG